MNLNLQKARLTRLCDGRPLNFSESFNGEIILTILSDDNTKSVSLKFDELLTDEQIKERFERITKCLKLSNPLNITS